MSAKTMEILARLGLDRVPPPPPLWRRWCTPYLVRLGACGCEDGEKTAERVPLYRWLGLLTLGFPYPLRWRFDRRLCWIIYQPMPGCGCFRWIKDLASAPCRMRNALCEWWTYTYGDLCHA